MDVKINGGSLQPAQTPKRSPGGSAAHGASFADNLKAAADKAPETPEAVFERALSDRENPELQQIDDYLERLIEKEMKTGGGA